MQSNAAYGVFLLAFCIVMQMFTAGIGGYAFAFFVVPWMQEFNAPRSELMVAMTGFSIVAAVASLLAGPIIDRHSPRRLVLIGTFVLVAMLFGLAAAPAASVVVVLFAGLLPVAMALSGPLIANTLVARTFIQRRGMALGICALGTSVGGLVMPVLVTTLLADFNWREVMQILGVAVLVLIPPAAWFLLAGQVPPSSGTHGGPLAVFKALKPPILLLTLAYVAPLMIFLGVLHNIGAYSADRGVSQQQAGVAVSLASLLMAAAKFGVGALADRVNHTLIYFGMLACAVIAMLLIISGSPFIAFNIGVPILGGTVGGLMPLISAIIAQRFGPERFGAMMGVVLASAGLAGVAPAAVSLIRDLGGSYNIAFAALLVLLVPAIVGFIGQQRLLAPAAQPAG